MTHTLNNQQNGSREFFLGFCEYFWKFGLIFM